MNKKLVKQLEGVGFVSKVSRGIRITLEVKGGYAFDYYEGDDRVHFYKDNEPVAASIHCPTFAQIAAKVKEITGVDLTKKTKREEIEELKVRFGKMEDAIKNMQGMCDKQSSEMQADEAKGFNVDDRVVVSEKAKGLFGFQIEAMETQTELVVSKVIDTQPKGYECMYLDSYVGVFPAKWLQHAPKEAAKGLEWGDWRRLNGEKVLIVHKLVTTAVVYFENGNWEEASVKDLKPL